MVLIKIFELLLKFVKPNFTILNIKSLKKDPEGGFWLESSRDLTPNSIVEYKYSNKVLKHFVGASLGWPPLFRNRNPKVRKVIYKGVDRTQDVKSFAGPLQNDFNPFSLFKIVRKPRVSFRFFGATLSWCEYLEFTNIDPSELIIHRG